MTPYLKSKMWNSDADIFIFQIYNAYDAIMNINSGSTNFSSICLM